MMTLSSVFVLFLPIIFVVLSENRNNLNGKRIILRYLKLFAINNLLTNLAIISCRDYSVYRLAESFFLKYALLNLTISVITALIVYCFKNHISFVKRKEKQVSKFYKKILLPIILLFAILSIFIFINLTIDKVNVNVFYFKIFNLKQEYIHSFIYWIIVISKIVISLSIIIIFLQTMFSHYEVNFKIKNKRYEIENIILKTVRIIIIPVFIFLIFISIIDFVLYKDIVQDQVIVFEEPDTILDLKVYTFGRKLPTRKKEGKIPVIISLKYKFKKVSVFGEISVQGTGSEQYPKKNWSLYFYEDYKMSKPLKLKIGNSIPTNKWVAKAEWIDASLLRDPLAYNLWGEMVDSRSDIPKNEIQKRLDKEDIIDEARGYPLTHPIKISFNGSFSGVFNLTLSHDPNNYNIDKDNDNHLYFEFDARYNEEIADSWESFKSDLLGLCLDFNCPKEEDVSESAKKQIDKLGKLLNSPIEEFRINFDKYLDRINVIDMMLYVEMIYDHDALAYDIIVVSYDQEKFFFLPWDKDSTFGMGFGLGLLLDTENKILINKDKEVPRQIPWHKVYHAFTEEVEARYKELREKGVFSEKSIEKKIDEIYSKIPDRLMKKEHNRWTKRASVTQTDKDQIVDWFEKRLITLDEHFNYTK